MSTTLIYILKVNIAIALFYMFYRLFFANDTLWKTRRYYMLFSIAASFIYPFLSIQSWIEKQQPVKEILTNYVALQEFTVTANEQVNAFSIDKILLVSYCSVCIVLIVKLLIQLISIVRIKHSSTLQTIHGVQVHALNQAVAPFSFFSNIYINPSLHTNEELSQIIAHESTHVNQKHSFDVVVSELLCIAFWINPATWLLKREIRQNLEYLADNTVIESGFDSKSYQYHLLQLSYQCPDYKITNKFNILPLKKRIIMMNQKKSSKSSAFKYLMIAPLTLALVFVSNAETFASSLTQESQKDPNKIDEVVVVGYGEAKRAKNEITVVAYNTLTPESTVSESGTQKATTENPTLEKVTNPQQLTGNTDKDEKNTVFEVVEKMPVFPGGDEALFKFLGMNVRYPVEAQKNGIQGRVICSFVINKDGSVVDCKVLRSVNQHLDAEAVRVIRAMPNWTPGEQRGEKVRVRYTLPVNFRLNGPDNTLDKTKAMFSPSDKPLIVLEGEIMPSNFDISSLNPNKIETIDVKKDIAATEAYGEKGKNGVIIIKMKK